MTLSAAQFSRLMREEGEKKKLRDLYAEPLVDYLTTRFPDISTDPVERMKLVSSLSSEELLKLIFDVNATVQGEDIETHAFLENPGGTESAGVITYAGPEPDDIPRILAAVHENLQVIAQDPISKDALERFALAASGVATSIHAFKDGNGRTSRVLAFLVLCGIPDVREAHELLGQDFAMKSSPGLVSIDLENIMLRNAYERYGSPANFPRSFESPPLLMKLPERDDVSGWVVQHIEVAAGELARPKLLAMLMLKLGLLDEAHGLTVRPDTNESVLDLQMLLADSPAADLRLIGREFQAFRIARVINHSRAMAFPETYQISSGAGTIAHKAVEKLRSSRLLTPLVPEI